ncbi:MAG: type II toxin-antitoxin system PemK/MazF family toxin [Dehalococcoidia bacterium]
MTSPRPGDLWIADITYTTGTASKRRPVLVLWTDADDVIVALVTSAEPRTRTDVHLADWKRARLKVPSTVRLLRLDSLEVALLVRRVGRVSRRDAAALVSAWQRHVVLRL